MGTLGMLNLWYLPISDYVRKHEHSVPESTRVYQNVFICILYNSVYNIRVSSLKITATHLHHHVCMIMLTIIFSAATVVVDAYEHAHMVAAAGGEQKLSEYRALLFITARR